MRVGLKQACAAVLALSAADVGGWALFAPHSFYQSFPLVGHHWLPVLGAYNEHMTRDVGGLYLALLAISVWATLRPRTETMRLVGVAWLAFSVPHFVFHMFHMDMYGTTDQVANVVTLGGTVVLAALLLPPNRRAATISSADADSNRTEVTQ